MKQMTMPTMGESIIECTVIAVLKKVGDSVEADESVLEVATDKVDTEVPCPFSGIVSEIMVKVGDIVPIGAVVMRFESKENGFAKEVNSLENIDFAYNKLENGEKTEPLLAFTETILSQPLVSAKSVEFYSPLVQTIAKMEGISEFELKRIVGTGSGGRVTKDDILQYVQNRKLKAKASAIPSTSDKTTKNFLKSEVQLGQIIPFDRMRKLIAERMIESQRIAAHVTSYVECDVTNMVRWRESIKDDFRQRMGYGFTFTPIFIEIIAKAILDLPQINATIEGDSWVVKPNINIGVAVAMPNGNLIVPVVHNADQLSLLELADKVNQLTIKGREGTLKPDDLVGGTYTISNIGTFDNLMGTPIIMQPQIAIMAIGAIKKRPVVIETPDGDTIGIRSMMYLSHSYDHRVVDGILGGMFVKRVADYLSSFDLNRAIF